MGICISQQDQGDHREQHLNQIDLVSTNPQPGHQAVAACAPQPEHQNQIDRVYIKPEPEHHAVALRSTIQTSPPPCSWTKKTKPTKCHRHRPTGDECRNDDGATPCSTSQQPHHQADDEAIPTTTTPSQAATDDADITMPYLPEDVLQHIHSRMKMRDAARAACVSRSFLCFWRQYPNLEFNMNTLAASRQPLLKTKHDRGRYVFTKARQVLENHSGTGVRRIKLNLIPCSRADIDAGLLDAWLRSCFAVKPGIATAVDFSLRLPPNICYTSDQYYNFPYWLLSPDSDDDNAGVSSSIQFHSLHLACCGFHPTPTATTGTPPLAAFSRSLSRVWLNMVRVTGDELGTFLSSCLALEQLDLTRCGMVATLRIPRALRKLKVVRVRSCWAMTAIESHAPNLSILRYEGLPLSGFTLGDSLETKELDVHAGCRNSSCFSMLQYAGSNLPSIAANLESLVLSTDHQELKAPAITDRFKNLKHLVICLGEYDVFCKGHDFLSLACFLHACSALETFILRIPDSFRRYHLQRGKPDEIPSQSSTRQQEIPGIRYGDGLGSLRKATITGFFTAKSLVELTWYILETASASLDCLVLDATPGYDGKRSSDDRCLPMSEEATIDAENTLTYVRKYVEPKVPLGVELTFLGPCNRCHAILVPKMVWRRTTPVLKLTGGLSSRS